MGKIITQLSEKDKTDNICLDVDSCNCFILPSENEYNFLANSKDKVSRSDLYSFSVLSKTKDNKYVFLLYDDKNFSTEPYYSISNIASKNAPEIIIRDLTGFYNLKEMFEEYNVERLSFKNIDTSNVTNMAKIFYNCSKLQNLDLSLFNTKSVTNMEYIFCGCSNLNILNINNFNTKNVTNMKEMFSGCQYLDNIAFPDTFDTSNVKDMSFMFHSCGNMKKLNFPKNFDTSKVISMDNMFSNCKNLEELDLSNFNTCNVVNMDYMFNECRSLKTLILGSNFNVKPKGISLDDINGYKKEFSCASMFNSCNLLECVITDKPDDNLLNALNDKITSDDLKFIYKTTDEGVKKNGYYRKNYVEKK